MRITSIACTINFQIGLPKQTNIASQPWWSMYSNVGTLSILSNQGYSEYCQWCNFRKGRKRMNSMSYIWQSKTYSSWKPLVKLGKAKRLSKNNMIWLKKQLNFYVILTMLACEISILKFSWAMKSHLHVFILKKEVWFESQISPNW